MTYESYLRFGDRNVLEENYPAIQLWLNFLKTKTADGLLQKWGGAWDFLGDWVGPGRDQGANREDDNSTLFFNNSYYYWNLRQAARIASWLGRDADAKSYEETAAALGTVIQKTFFDAGANTYACGTQTYLAFPLYTGQIPDALQAPVRKRLEEEITTKKDGHIDTGVLGTYFMLRMLARDGRGDLAFRMIARRGYPGWEYMLANGATSMWEQWDAAHAKLHSSFTSVGGWFIEGGLGIQPDPEFPGYGRILIRPGARGVLEWAKGALTTPRGPVKVDWRNADGTFRMELEVPVGASAMVILDRTTAASVKLDGKAPENIKTDADGSVRFEVGRGKSVIETGSTFKK